MELFLNINNGIFIIKNAFPKELIEEMLNEIKSNIDKKDFKIRMSYSINDEKSVEIRSDYKDCNNEIFEIFNNINSTNVSSKYIEKKISNELDNNSIKKDVIQIFLKTIFLCFCVCVQITILFVILCLCLCTEHIHNTKHSIFLCLIACLYIFLIFSSAWITK